MAGNEFIFTFIATVISVMLLIAGSLFLDTRYYHNRVPHLLVWLVFLGMAIAYSDTSFRKKILSVFAVSTFILMWTISIYMPISTSFFDPWYPHNAFPYFPIISVLAIINIKRVSLPMKFARLLRVIANSSLFIHLTHLIFVNDILKLLPRQPDGILISLLAIIFGILSWKAWTYFQINMANILSKPNALIKRLSLVYLDSRLPR